MTLLRDEREALCDTMLAAGPDAPTLCEGWAVLDLATHLVLRQTRPDVALGLSLPPLRARALRVAREHKARGLTALVEQFRAGPPRWSPTSVPAVEEKVDLAELVVHHEDVRRAVGLGPREDVEELADLVWRSLRPAARVAMWGTGVPVVAVSTDGRRQVLRPGPHPVVLTGGPVDLLLRVFGRTAAQVEVGGPSLSVVRFEAARTAV